MQAVSPAAQLSGARIGMPLSEAKSLVGRSRRFHGYHVFEHEPSKDTQALRALAMDCQIFSPIIGLEDVKQPGSLLMDIHGLTHLFGGDIGLRSQIHEHFRSLGYLVATAIAPTVGQAWGLARFGDASLPAPEDGSCPTEPATPSCFGQLPIQALRLSRQVTETLQQLGLETVEQVRNLPRAGLRSRFGDQVTKRLDQADGMIEEKIQALHPPVDYTVEQFLDYPITDKKTIQVIVGRLAETLCRQMKAAGRGGLVWKFQLLGPAESRNITNQNSSADPLHQTSAGRSCHPLTIKLFQPVAQLDQLMPLIDMQLEALFQRKSGKSKLNQKQRATSHLQVQEICVSVSNCVLLAERQRKLFDENPRLDKQALSHLINRLSSRLGSEHVLRPKLQSGNQPENQFRFEPLVGQSEKPSQRVRRTTGFSDPISPLQRPLALHSQPLGIKAVSLDDQPQDASGVPALFIWDGQRFQVTRRWGPERIETAWWRGPTIRRDYWRVEIDHSRWWWVFRNLRNRRWYLHGEF